MTSIWLELRPQPGIQEFNQDILNTWFYLLLLLINSENITAIANMPNNLLVFPPHICDLYSIDNDNIIHDTIPMKCDLHLLECFNLYYFSWVWENAYFSHVLLDVQCTDLLIVFHIRWFSMLNLTSCSLQYIVNAIIWTSILFSICFPGTISTSFLTSISSYIVYNVETTEIVFKNQCISCTDNNKH